MDAERARAEDEPRRDVQAELRERAASRAAEQLAARRRGHDPAAAG